MSGTFHERFNIQTHQNDARIGFVNRVHNLIFDSLYSALGLSEHESHEVTKYVMSRLGKRQGFNSLSIQVGSEFLTNLRALEALWESLARNYQSRQRLAALVQEIFRQSETDIGIAWNNGIFIPTGAKLLDDVLVNDALGWLRAPEYISVLKPFQKSLEHLLECDKKPSLTSDVITDAYEALEALGKVATGRNVDLSSNREALIAKIGASREYSKLLKEYIDYAHNFRHAANPGTQKPTTTKKDAESFLYLTGWFIRLAIG